MLFVPENEKLEEKASNDKAEGSDEKKVDTTDDSVLLFTLDISGSMGATVCQRVNVFSMLNCLCESLKILKIL